MSARRLTIVSTFIVWHLAAILIAAIPQPDQLAAVAGTSRLSDDSVSAVVRPRANLLSRVLIGADRFAAALVTPVRPLVVAYLTPFGLEQAWNMFANPPLTSDYVRVRYYVREPDGRGTSLDTELVFPLSPSGLHFTAAFRGGHQDKAVSNAASSYIREWNRRRMAGIGGSINKEDPAVSRNMEPVVAYFRDRFAEARYRTTGTRPDVVRTEAWYGVVQSRPPGEDRLFELSHAAALSRYPTRAAPASTMTVPVLQHSEHEADITWILLFATPE